MEDCHSDQIKTFTLRWSDNLEGLLGSDLLETLANAFMEEQLSAKSRLERSLRTRLSSRQQRNISQQPSAKTRSISRVGGARLGSMIGAPVTAIKRLFVLPFQQKYSGFVPRILLMLLKILVW